MSLSLTRVPLMTSGAPKGELSSALAPALEPEGELRTTFAGAAFVSAEDPAARDDGANKPDATNPRAMSFDCMDGSLGGRRRDERRIWPWDGFLGRPAYGRPAETVNSFF